MHMPDFKPIGPPSPRSKQFIVASVAIFIVLAFAFAYWINLHEWR